MIRKISDSLKSIKTIVFSDIKSTKSAERVDELINFNSSKGFNPDNFFNGAFKLFGITAATFIGVLGVSALSSTMTTSPEIFKYSQSESITVENIGSHLGGMSLAMSEEFKRSDIIFISQNDTNLAHIISNVEEKMKPQYNEPDFDLNKDWILYAGYQLRSIFNSNDAMRQFAYSQINSKEFKGQHALSIYEDPENKIGRNFCYIKSFGRSQFEGRHSSPIFFSTSEAVVAIKNHEQAHCMDRKELLVETKFQKANNATLQAEIIADVFASLKTIAITGNTDTVKYTMLPFRIMPEDDHLHQTTPFLKKLLDIKLDMERISKNDSADLWKYTQEIVGKELFYTDMVPARNEWFNGQMSYQKFSSQVHIEDVSEKVSDEKDDKKKPTRESAMSYGNNLYETMINHYVYHDKMSDKAARSALLDVVHDISNISGDKELSTKVEFLRQQLEDETPLQDKAFMELVSISITASKEQFLVNDKRLHEEDFKFTSRAKEIDSLIKNNNYSRPEFLFEVKAADKAEDIFARIMSRQKQNIDKVDNISPPCSIESTTCPFRGG